jgi:hypothetical protein
VEEVRQLCLEHAGTTLDKIHDLVPLTIKEQKKFALAIVGSTLAAAAPERPSATSSSSDGGGKSSSGSSGSGGSSIKSEGPKTKLTKSQSFAGTSSSKSDGSSTGLGSGVSGSSGLPSRRDASGSSSSSLAHNLHSIQRPAPWRDQVKFLSSLKGLPDFLLLVLLEQGGMHFLLNFLEFGVACVQR